MDTDNSGNIDAGELQAVLRLGHLNFSMAMTAHMIRMFDKSKTGKVNYQEFQHLHQFLLQVQRDFQSADIYKRGSLNEQQVGPSGVAVFFLVGGVRVVHMYVHTYQLWTSMGACWCCIN